MQNFIFAHIKLPMRFRSILAIALFTTILVGCSTSGSFYKHGFKLEEAGLSEEAVKYYYMSLQKNSNNIDSKIHLKKSAQLVLDDKLAEFYQAYGSDQHKAAVYNYLDAEKFINSMNRYVQLEMPSYYAEYFDEEKNKYLEERYESGLSLIEESQFEKAEIIFKEISQLDPLYKDVKDLKKITEVEPLYNEAIENYSANQFKIAHEKFERVVKIKGNYKEAISYKKLALEEATMSIALLPIELSDSSDGKKLADQYYAQILKELLKRNNKYITFIDRLNTQKIIEEQKLGLSGLIDESSAAKTGELLGAKIVITGQLVNMKAVSNPVKAYSKQGYRAYRVKKFSVIGSYYYYVTEYKKVTYKEYHGNTSVNTSFQFQMISVETGEVLLSDVFELSKQDKVDYALYEGDHRMLYGGSYKYKNLKSTTDEINNSIAQKQNIDLMLSSRHRKLNSIEKLKSSLIEEIAKKLADKIDLFEKKR